VNLGVSIGISASPRDGVDVESLLRCADTAIVRGQGHKPRVRVLRRICGHAALRTRLGLISDLRQAIEDSGARPPLSAEDRGYGAAEWSGVEALDPLAPPRSAAS